MDVFQSCPWVLHPYVRQDKVEADEESTAGKEIKLNSTRYDEAAIASYQLFADLKAQGLIPKHVRFQVGMPTPLSVVAGFVMDQYRATVEPLYEQQLITALRNIQAAIPADQLAIQIEVVTEIGMIESVGMYHTNILS